MKYLKLTLLLFIFFFLWIFIRDTNPHLVLASVNKIGYGFILILLSTFLAYFFGTLGWRHCMGVQGSTVSVWNLFMIRHIGETVGMINPSSIVGGEAVKIFLLKDSEVTRSMIITSVLISRIIMIVTQIILFLLAFFVFCHMEGRFSLISIPFGKLAACVVAVLLLSALIVKLSKPVRHALIKTQHGIKMKKRAETFREKMRRTISEVLGFAKHNRKDVVFSFFFFVLHWVFGSLEFYFILTFLGIDATVIHGLLIDMGVIFFKAAGAVVPGQIGVEEYGNKVMLGVIGVTGSGIWITASLLRRARQLIWILFGFIAYLLVSRRSHVFAVRP